MMIPAFLLLPALVGVAFASSEKAKVYILPQPKHLIRQQTTPTLSPEEARLVIAQRAGVSQHYRLDQISPRTLTHINTFGRQQSGLFEDDNANGPMQLIIIADSISPRIAEQLLTVYASTQVAFEISDPPSQAANAKLAKDISIEGGLDTPGAQCDLRNAINPLKDECWTQDARILHLETRSKTYDAKEILDSIPKLVGEGGEFMEAMIILMPESSRHSPKAHDWYDTPSLSLQHRNVQVEEPIESNDAIPTKSPTLGGSSKQTHAPPSIPSAVNFLSCYDTNESCNAGTGHCSGHGACYAKFNSTRVGESCYTCACQATVNISKTDGVELTRSTYWGGRACQKEDISGPFWLLFGVSLVLMGVVAAGIGMLFSVGEEKLPGVIGAGVSGPKAR